MPVMDARSREFARAMLRAIEAIPDGMHYNILSEALLGFQPARRSAAEVREVLARIFGLTEPWTKQLNVSCGWWQYSNKTKDGIGIEVYGDHQGPKACRQVTEKVEVEEKVPVAFETVKVTKTVTKWVCPENGDEK